MKYLFTACLCLSFYFSKADGTIITGNTSVAPGSIETYQVSWESWGSVYENYAIVTWTVTGGTLLSSDKHTVTIQWDNIPTWLNGTGSIEVYEDLGSQSGNLSIEIINFVEGILETCNGVLGPPAVFINFGTGINPGAPLPSGTTTYIYNSSCAIFSGEYTVTNSTVGCRGPWLGLPEDHTTGDVNGYMLLIDADDHRGEVYRATVPGLTDAFEYEFSVWIANIADGYPNPRVHFELWSTTNPSYKISQSGSYSITFNSQTPWQKIAFMFLLPLGTTSVQVVLVNEHANADGNDFVVDDISFAPCYPPIIASFTPNPTITPKSYICDNGTVTFYSWWPTPTPPYANAGFQWQRSTDNGNTWADIAGAISMSYTRTESTANRYYYRVKAYDATNPSQFVISNSIIFFVQKMVVDTKTFYVSGCVSSPTQLNPTYNLQYSDPSIPLSYSYNWSPGTYLSNTQIANPTITLPTLPPNNPPNPPFPPPPVNYNYTLTVQNTNYGCSGSNTQTVAHVNPRKVYLFCAFTPNGDGQNDYFRPINIHDYTYFGAEFSIFNRWGQLIFYRNWGLTLLDWSWDGTVGGVPQDPDVFVYTLRIPGCPTNYEGAPGCNVNPPTSNNNYTISGSFVLIR